MNQERMLKLAAGLSATAIGPASPGYDEARKVWNGTIDRHPEMIVRCGSTAQVVEAVKFAREHRLKVSVRGGGHHVAGGAMIEGGLVIDLSPMRSASFDSASGIATAEGGCQLQDVDNATLQHGVSVPMGVFGETGIGGLTLSGGYGWQCRSHGLTCDHLVSAEVVTANGSVVTASATENADLFWALRGGGTNMGVVTSFRYRTRPVEPEMHMLFVLYPLDAGRQVVAGLRDFMSTASRRVGVLGVVWTLPSAEPFPVELWGRPFVGIAGPYLGPVADGELIMQPLRQLAEPMLDMSGTMPFSAIQQLFDEDYPSGRRYYWRSCYLRELHDEVVDVYLDAGKARPSPLSSLDLWVLGGAIGDVGMTESPIAHRAAPFLIGIESNWEDPAQDAANIGWARQSQQAFRPYSDGSYLNFDDPGESGRLAAIYGPNLPRLVEVKQRYDPDNLFRSALLKKE